MIFGHLIFSSIWPTRKFSFVFSTNPTEINRLKLPTDHILVLGTWTDSDSWRACVSWKDSIISIFSVILVASWQRQCDIDRQLAYQMSKSLKLPLPRILRPRPSRTDPGRLRPTLIQPNMVHERWTSERNAPTIQTNLFWIVIMIVKIMVQSCIHDWFLLIEWFHTFIIFTVNDKSTVSMWPNQRLK